MFKVKLLYPNEPGAKFDFDYYQQVHMPRTLALLGPGILSCSVEKGASPGPPWSEPAFLAICSFTCSSREAFEEAFFPHAEELQGDIPNYTNVTPMVQFSEVLPIG